MSDGTQGWYRHDGDTLILSVHAQPGAKKTEIQGLHGEALKIRIAALPVEGAANEELRRFLAKCFAVTHRQVRLIAGAASRSKRFAISGSRTEPGSLLRKD